MLINGEVVAGTYGGLGGSRQTTPRAELMALVVTLEHFVRTYQRGRELPRIVSDCAYVVKTAFRLAQKRARNNSCVWVRDVVA